jgi:hypothetical protein
MSRSVALIRIARVTLDDGFRRGADTPAISVIKEPSLHFSRAKLTVCPRVGRNERNQRTTRSRKVRVVSLRLHARHSPGAFTKARQPLQRSFGLGPEYIWIEIPGSVAAVVPRTHKCPLRSNTDRLCANVVMGHKPKRNRAEVKKNQSECVEWTCRMTMYGRADGAL